MASVVSQVVAAYFETAGYKCSVADEEKGILATGFRFNGGEIDIYILFSDDNHVSIQGVNFIQVSKEKYDTIYKVLNNCNAKYTHIKLYLDEKHDQIIAEDQDIIQIDSCGPECLELIQRMVAVVEDAYPIIMKAMWA